jgi:nitrogen fixation protein FixH
MPHQLSQFDFELPAIEEWLSGDDRALAFQVVDADGDGVDISNATVEWRLFERPYHDEAADAVLTGSDSGVELVTDSRVDSTIGQWEVRVDADATEDLWGEYWHRPRVTQMDESTASWRGRIELTA